MKNFTKAIAVSVAFVFALALGGCGGKSDQTTLTEGGAGFEVTELAGTSGSIATVGGSNESATVEVTLAEGESLVVMGTLESGQVDVLITQDGEDISTDTVYQGSCYSELGLDPGTYTVELTANEAVGTVYALAYPSDQIDVMNTDTEDIITEVLENVG